MADTLSTLFLNPTPGQPWDLCADSSGNIAVAAPPYATAQDAASYCLTELGECYYDTTLGVPTRAQVLQQAPAGSGPVQRTGLPPLSLVEQQYAAAALTVPGVVQAVALLAYDRAGRTYSGQVQVTDATGAVAAVQLPETTT